ncbi:hypothetical protein MRY87_07565 [bacterium]|nr:hypothetical protein [bacterium]
MSSALQTYSLLFSREEIDDVAATWNAATEVTKAGLFTEAVRMYYEEIHHIFSLEVYLHRQIIEFCFACRPEDFPKIASGLQVMLGGAWMEVREDYTRTVPDTSTVMVSEFRSLCAHAMPYLTFNELVMEVMAPLLNVLSLLPVEQNAVVQFVVKRFPDDPKRNFYLRMSMWYWLSVFIRNPYQWFWPGTYERHLWGNKRMKGPMFWASLRVGLWSEDLSEGDPEIEQAQLAALEHSMDCIHCTFRFLDMHALGITARVGTKTGLEALPPLQERHLTKPHVLSGDELATFYHPVFVHNHSNLKHLLAGTAAAPPGLIGTPRGPQWSFIGVTKHQGESAPFGISRTDREGQLHIIGKSGSGKSKLLELLVREDLRYGYGFAFLDCHGDLTDDLLRAVPRDRIDDVYLLDFTDRAAPPKINPMIYARGEYRELFFPLFVNQLLRQQDGGKPSDKAKRFLLQVVVLIAEQPKATLAEILTFLLQHEYRELLIENLLSRSSSDQFVSAAREYFSIHRSEVENLLALEEIQLLKKKLGTLLAANLISDVFQQEQDLFPLRKIIEERKILIIRAPKQTLGNDNTRFVGSLLLLLVHTIAEYRREKGLVDPSRDSFLVYLDEFQNFASPALVSWFESAPKRGLSYTISHQTLGQLDEELLKSLRESLKNLIAFQLGGSDAVAMSDALSPSFGANDVMHLNVRRFYIRMTLNREPVSPFSAETEEVTPFEEDYREEIIAASRTKVHFGGSVEGEG